MTALCDRPARALRDGIARGEISARALVDSCIARIEAADPALNAIVAERFAAARDEADSADAAVADGEATGPLHGLPVAIKDLTETAGLRTTFGSTLYKDHVPTHDDATVVRLKRAGAIVLAKTNTPEFGAGANTTNDVYGATGNPFDPALTCGGSSGGSAVALAASMVPLATGSDLGGSLRTPAGYCGIVGLRPTPGLVPRPGALAAWSPLAVEGPMARSVDDCALLLAAMAGSDPADPLSAPVAAAALAEPVAADLGTLRVAFSADLGFAPVDDGIRATFAARTAAIRDAFAAAGDRDPPLAGADAVFETLRGVGFVAQFQDGFRRHPEAFGPNVRDNVERGLALTAAEIGAAQVAHTRLYRRFLAYMDDVDLLICPVAAVPPFDKEVLFPTEIGGRPMATYVSWIALTYGLTLTGHPVLALPCGRDATNMPFGLQLVGKPRGERALLAAAAALEALFAADPALARPVPKLPRQEDKT